MAFQNIIKQFRHGVISSVRQSVFGMFAGLKARFSYSMDIATKTITFTDASTIGDFAIVSWLWDLGDTGTSTNQNPVSVYAAFGTYVVKLTVTDADGAVSSYTQTIRLEEPASGFPFTFPFTLA